MSLGLSYISVLYMPQGGCEFGSHTPSCRLEGWQLPRGASFYRPFLELPHISSWICAASQILPQALTNPMCQGSRSFSDPVIASPAFKSQLLTAMQHLIPTPKTYLSFLDWLWLIQSVRQKVSWLIICVVKKKNLKFEILFYSNPRIMEKTQALGIIKTWVLVLSLSLIAVWHSLVIYSTSLSFSYLILIWAL